MRVGQDGLESLPVLALLRCVGCRSGGLRPSGAALECPGCGRSYPVQADIPVMVGDAAAVRGPLMDPVEARSVLASLHVPADPFATLRARRASGARVRVGGAGWAGLPDDGRLLGRPRPLAPSLGSPDPAGEPRCQWLGEYLPRAMRPGEELLANVRFRNAGSAPMASAGEGRVTLACQWRDSDGRAVAGAEVRTPLPIDLAPGQVLTLPIRMVAPDGTGRRTVSLAAVQEGVRWLEPPFGPFPVHLREDAGFTPPAHWVTDGPGPHEPEADRARAVGLARGWLAGYRSPRVLELCGGATPVTACLPGEAVNVDGDLLALQLGCLVPRRAGSAVLPVCADLLDLPLPAGHFDAAVCFGALHASDDPAAILRGLRVLLRPGGFIGLFCEPVGQTWPGAATPSALAELRRGRNPQGFSLLEWARIFASARLRAAELVIDGASLKARLQPEDAGA